MAENGRSAGGGVCHPINLFFEKLRRNGGGEAIRPTYIWLPYGLRDGIRVKPLLFFTLTNTLEYLSKDFRLTADELAAERQKGFISGKPMENEDVLEALHEEGLF